MGGGQWERSSGDGAIQHRRSTHAARSRGFDLSPRLRTGVERLGCGVDSVAFWNEIAGDMRRKLAIWTGAVALAALLLATVLPALAPPSNCGGNSHSLSVCRQYALAARLLELDGKNEFRFDDLEETDRMWVAKLAKSSRTEGKDFLVSTNFAIPQTGRVLVIVCEQAFDNVPQPAIWNLYRRNPAHAVGYSDGNCGLISPVEYAALDLTGFVSLRTLELRGQTEAVQP